MINETSFIVEQRTRTNSIQPGSPIDLIVANDAVDKLITEGGESFYNYVNWIGLANDPDLIVLSSRHNYYYDAAEMNNVKTLINLKELNQVKRIKSLLLSFLHFLPQNGNFVGCFVDNKKIDRFVLRNSASSYEKIRRSDEIDNSIISRSPLINMLFSKLDLRTNIYMTEESVKVLLRSYGFKVMDMTELNGITFFHSQKAGAAIN